MNTAPDCVPCILKQVLNVARRVSDDEWLHRKVLEKAVEPLLAYDDEVGPAELANDVILKTLRTMGTQQPYAQDRRTHVDSGKALAAKLAPKIDGSPDPLGAALVVAAAANVFDRLLIDPNVDVAAAIESCLARGLASSDGDDLREELGRSKRILYVFDTAGEAPFDLALIARLGEREVTGVVRPAQGRLSATKADLERAGAPASMPLVEAVAEGSGSFALDNPEFRRAFAGADLVIAKGLTSWELLHRERAKPVFVLLSVKCEVAARTFGAPIGAVVLSRPS